MQAALETKMHSTLQFFWNKMAEGQNELLETLSSISHSCLEGLSFHRVHQELLKAIIVCSHASP